MHLSAVDPRRWNLKKTRLFQRKLNELPQDVTLATKFCLTFQIQYFEVSFFVVFKCQFFKEFLFKALNSSGICKAQNSCHQLKWDELAKSNDFSKKIK